MPEKQKLIGVCLSQAYTYINAGYIAELERAAREEGYRVAVFNTALDFYWYGQGNTIARSIFHAINYDDFSALVVVHESFHDPQLLDQIVSEAAAKNVPVFCLGAVWPGCVSILYDYYEPYKSLIRHVLKGHGARDTFYISGMEDEANSALRVQCYREALEECGLKWSRENVAYGLFIEDPTRRIVEDLIRTRKKMPEAIFCANDYMAMTVCDTLRQHGYRVPQDVMVTGFDGIPIATLFTPQLATCSMDTPALARKTMALILALARGERVDPVQHHSFLPVPSESCGCVAKKRKPMDALTLFRRAEMSGAQENHLYHTVERMLMRENMRDMLIILSYAIPPESAVYLNRSFLTTEQSAEYDMDHLEPVLIKIPHQDMDVKDLPIQEIQLRDLAREFGEGPGVTMFMSIHSDSTVVGCFAAHTDCLDDQNQIFKRLSDVMNLAFTVVLGNVRQRKLLTHLENSLYLDPLTGMSNLKGLTRWFDGYTAAEESHRRCVALSVYNIHRYSYLYETYGISETEEIVTLVSRGLREANPEALHIARINEKQFVVVNDAAAAEGIGEAINRAVRDFYQKMEDFNATAGKSFFLEVNCGCTTMEAGWEQAALGNLIQLATGEMYLNRMRSGVHEAEKSPENASASQYNSFRLLIEKNLFRYFFQPIVDAHTGQIYAYEALMRTDPVIHMQPLEILEIAREYNHLYDVEKETLFGIMERFTKDYGVFHNNKVFINTIPGHFLNPQDCEEMIHRFEGYLDCFVFELTEQDVTSDEELARLKQIHKAGGQTQIAIDDFGTGHSNIVNLLRYSPQIIKIDRALISGIQNDSNKQLFVRNTIEFAHRNGIKALAEGVETAEELRCVISCGADLIQGFYTARPAEMPIAEIPTNIREEILAESLRRSSEDFEPRVYLARDGETLHLIDLALQNYTMIRIPSGEFSVVGESVHTVDMVLRIERGAKARVNMDHVSLRGAAETPIQIGEHARLQLHLIGQNTLYKEGIRVPESAEVRITGSGNLEIQNDRNYAVGIGANFNDPYGGIEIEMDGQMRFRSSGDKVVCLGGGRSLGTGIRVLRGDLRLEANGINVLGIGSAEGSADIRMEDGARAEIHLQGNDALGIGSVTGSAEISSRGQMAITVESERAVGIGTMSGGAEIEMTGGKVSSVVKCDMGTCVGSFTGQGTIRMNGTEAYVHGEGNSVCGIGSLQGACGAEIEKCVLRGDLLAGEKMMLGNERSECRIFGGVNELEIG